MPTGYPSTLKRQMLLYSLNRAYQVNAVNLRINNEKIDVVDSVKFLGVHIDRQLKFNAYIS